MILCEVKLSAKSGNVWLVCAHLVPVIALFLKPYLLRARAKAPFLRLGQLLGVSQASVQCKVAVPEGNNDLLM